MTKQMNRLLKLEELGGVLLSVALYSQLSYPWWVFPACLLLPDLSMLGYLMGSKAGAMTYNFFHHKLLAILFLISGFFLTNDLVALTGVILLAHSSMDRMLGYGLKYPDSFGHTHMGVIGKDNSRHPDT